MIEITPDTVDVTWSDGTTTRLPHLWLRDNCWCTECRVQQTTEKGFELRTQPADLSASSAALNDDTLHITWPDGHATEYSAETIRELTSPRPPGWQAWGPQFTPSRFGWDDVLNNDGHAVAMIEDFLVTGAVLLVDGPTTPNALEDLAPRLGPVREVLFERIHNVELDPSGYNVAHTALELPPHNDMASYSYPPSVQALHFLANEATGGESVIVDSWGVLEGFRADDPSGFDALCAIPVPFRQFDADNETFATEPMVRLDLDGNIVAFRYSNQLMQPMNPIRPGVTEFYRAYHEVSNRLADRSNQVEFRTAAGECIVVASHRVLHARRSFVPDGRRHLQDAYFEHDNVRNHLTVAQRRLAGASA